MNLIIERSITNIIVTIMIESNMDKTSNTIGIKIVPAKPLKTAKIKFFVNNNPRMKPIPKPINKINQNIKILVLMIQGNKS